MSRSLAAVAVATACCACLSGWPAAAADTVKPPNVPPTVEFRTTPAADEQGVIWGPAPLEVRFNMCHVTDPDVGDDLRFNYDYEGSGQRDLGICHGQHVYLGERCVKATVCASDRQPGHDVCRSYDVCTDDDASAGGASPGVTRLIFWVWNGASSGNGTDSLQATVDGAAVFTLVTGDPAYTTTFQKVVVDISAYADGAAHQLGFTLASTGPTNFSLDDVAIRCGAGDNQVGDADFEAGAAMNPMWTQASTIFASPICSLATCGDGGSTAHARRGSWWVWLGGTSGAETASLVQPITIAVCN